MQGGEVPGCPAQVLFKMDKAGDGQLVELEDLCMNRELSFVGFTPQMFMEVGPPCAA